ncbi:MAG: ATP-dependent helicase [Bacteroidetes bacterium]|nr:MAG: ATP-dependent helicase [Bacteroidota bacterium]
MNDKIEVDFDGKEFTVICPFWDNERAKSIPERKWDRASKKWRVPAVKVNANYLKQRYADTELTESANKMISKIQSETRVDSLFRFPSWYKWKTEPRPHQMQALHKSYEMNEFAYFMEMRTGKSFVTIAKSCVHAMEGKVNALIVVVDSPYKVVWEDEFNDHCPIPYNLHILEAGKYKAFDDFMLDTKSDGIKVLVTGVEAYSQGKAAKCAERFALTHKCAMVVDESTSIKNPESIRTKRITDIGGLCEYRMILTGTPITQGIEDLFAQFRFLNWKIIGIKSYFAFKNRYCVMGGFEGRKIVGYKNVPELMEALKPYVFLCDAKDVSDPPERIYERCYVDPTKEQKRMFDELGDPFQMATYQNGNMLEVETVLERMIRYMQISAGLFPYDKEEGGHGVELIEGKNPKIEALIKTIHQARKETKIIIWTVFQPEIKLIVDSLKLEFGDDSVCEYHGQNVETRSAEYKRFQSDPSAKFFVTNKSGSKSLELAVASMHIFVTNSFSYETRKQAEARTNSSKQIQKNVLYVDIVMNHKIDKTVHAALERKESVSSYVKREMRIN